MPQGPSPAGSTGTNSCLGRPETTEHLTSAKDGKSSHLDLVEVSISGDERFRLRGHSQRHEVVVHRVVWHQAWRLDRVVEQDPFLRKPPREFLRLLPADVVLLGDPRMQQSLPHLVDELRTDDNLELADLPAIQELRRGT